MILFFIELNVRPWTNHVVHIGLFVVIAYFNMLNIFMNSYHAVKQCII